MKELLQRLHKAGLAIDESVLKNALAALKSQPSDFPTDEDLGDLIDFFQSASGGQGGAAIAPIPQGSTGAGMATKKRGKNQIKPVVPVAEIKTMQREMEERQIAAFQQQTQHVAGMVHQFQVGAEQVTAAAAAEMAATLLGMPTAAIEKALEITEDGMSQSTFPDFGRVFEDALAAYGTPSA